MKKRKYSVGYFSSYDRGLECLLDMWPGIKEQVPEATLDLAYGWNTFDKMYTDNPEMMQWKFYMVQKMNQDGIKHHGRLSHTELAKLMKTIKVWAYPTMFTETHCITALKAQLAGCYPVVNAVAALDETVAFGTKLYLDNLYENLDQQQQFINAVVDALKRDHETIPAKKFVLNNSTWHKVASQWTKVLI